MFGPNTYDLLPFMGVHKSYDVTKEYKDAQGNPRKLRFFIYQAYNAMGLIGTENNGIAVVDENLKKVLCDQIDRSKWDELTSIEDFNDVIWKISSEPRSRFQGAS